MGHANDVSEKVPSLADIPHQETHRRDGHSGKPDRQQLSRSPPRAEDRLRHREGKKERRGKTHMIGLMIALLPVRLLNTVNP